MIVIDCVHAIDALLVLSQLTGGAIILQPAWKFPVQPLLPLRRSVFVLTIRHRAQHSGGTASRSALRQVNAAAFGARLIRKLDKIEQSLPWGYRFEHAAYQPELIETVVIVLVVVLFLGLRTGVIVGTFVPLVMLFGVVMISFFDIEMQRMSLASTIIALVNRFRNWSRAPAPSCLTTFPTSAGGSRQCGTAPAKPACWKPV